MQASLDVPTFAYLEIACVENCEIPKGKEAAPARLEHIEQDRLSRCTPSAAPDRMRRCPMENQKEKLLSLTNRESFRRASDVCFMGAFASIGLSILVWGFRRATANEGHAERFGIFIGLWAPTFLILSDRLEKYSERPPTAPAPQDDESPQLESDDEQSATAELPFAHSETR